MPSLSTLVDNFNDGTIAPDWGNSYGGVSETGGRARVPCTTGFAGYQTAYSWTFAGASLYVKVPTVPAASTATEAYCGMLVNSPTAGTRIGFTIKAVGSLLRMQSDSGYFDGAAVEIAYNATTHAFLRLREDGTNVYWDTSPDGSTWTNRRTLATPAWVTTEIDTCALDMSAHRDAGTDDYAEYDLFNTLANGATHDATGTGSMDVTVTAAAQHTAVMVGSGSFNTDVAASASAVYYVTGSGSLDTDATASAASDVVTNVDTLVGSPTSGWAVSRPWR
ncbi:hypothetical protein [Streptomyces sp. NBC_01614]|uniref:hypothetical protein n=1 Tax=Streptomyces sp. NBC_01614 TaxID=2975897 RepID=UPI0038694449